MKVIDYSNNSPSPQLHKTSMKHSIAGSIGSFLNNSLADIPILQCLPASRTMGE